MDIWSQPMTVTDGVRLLLAALLIQAVPASGLLTRLFS